MRNCLRPPQRSPAPRRPALGSPSLFQSGHTLFTFGRSGEDLGICSDFRTSASKSALAKAGPKELPNLNHLFQTCKTEAVSEYGAIEETIAPVALATIADWILKRTGGPRNPSAFNGAKAGDRPVPH
jgi:hypothetical protein